MRTGPHLGGGPDFETGPDPAGQAPVGAPSATASARGGISSPSGGCPIGAALCGLPVGHSAQIRGNLCAPPLVVPCWTGREPSGSVLVTTQEGVTGFDFG